MALFPRRPHDPPPPEDLPAGEVVPCRCAAQQVLDLAVLLSQQADHEEVLRLIAAKGLPLFNADMVSVLMVNPRTQHTIKTIMRDGMPHDEASLRLVRINIIGWVMKHRQSILTEDIAGDPRFGRSRIPQTGVRSAMCVPIQREGQICGQILVTSQDRNRVFRLEDLELLERCAAVWGAFVGNSRRVEEYFRNVLPDDVLLSKYAPHGLLGKSPRFRELLRSVDAASAHDVRVFLEGPSGSGKELVARAIHMLGPRNQHRFVAIDCGAISANLVESELFGHVKGAFTGATQDRRGLLEEANHGTLFMDEIENLPYDMQAKLLRVLQEGEVRAVGADQSRKVDVRIIAASHTPAARLVREKTLREDLFYRLYVYPISIPTLNERSQDIPLLASHFAKECALRQQKKAEAFEPSLLHYMRERFWEGNIRELENFVERLVTIARPDQSVLDASLLSPELRKEFREISRTLQASTPRRALCESLQEHERQIIRETLIAFDWNQSRAARTLRISERAMRYKMAKLKIAREMPEARRQP